VSPPVFLPVSLRSQIKRELGLVAFAYQARFERSLPIADVLEAVTQHAEQTRTEAAAVYAASGIDIGA
jgi:hypothetical protein